MATGFNQRWKGKIIAAQLYLAKAGLFYESFTDTITAGTTQTQAGAVQLTSEINRVTVVGTINDGVKLPASAAGLTILIINKGTKACKVYGLGADKVDDITNTTGVVQMAGSVAFYVCATAGNWYSEGIGTGYSGSLSTFSYADALSANSGAVQAGATAITTSIARFTTVGGAGYSSVLPAAAAGLSITVIHGAAANNMNVFPAGTDQINGQVASTAYVQAPGSVVEYVTTATGVWHTIASPNNAVAAQQFTAVTNTTNFVLAGTAMAGTADVTVNCTGTLGSGQTITVPSVASLVAAIPNATAGQTYRLRIVNSSSANFAWTLTTASGWTLNGTMSIAQNTFRDFYVTLTTLAAIAVQSVGVGAGVL